VLDDGIDGFVVPIRDSEAISARLDLLARDRDRLAQMGARALASAAARYWDAFRHDLVRAVA
jgi:hypothetical protein